MEEREVKKKSLTLYTGKKPVGEVFKTTKGRGRLCYKIVIAKMPIRCPDYLRDKPYKYVSRKKPKKPKAEKEEPAASWDTWRSW